MVWARLPYLLTIIVIMCAWLDVVDVSQTYVESKVEGLEDQLRKMKTQVDELSRTNSDLVNTRNRMTTENSELQRQIHELETNYGSFSKNRGQLQSQLDDAKSKLEEEIRVTVHLYTAHRKYMTHLDHS